MLDAKILAAVISDRAAFDRISQYVTKQDFNASLGLWYDLVVDWYKRDKTSTCVDVAILQSRAERELPERHKTTYIEALELLPEVVSAENIVSDYLELRAFNLEMELAQAIAGRVDKSKRVALTEELLSVYNQEDLSDTSGIIIARGLDSMDRQLSRENLIKLAPKALNDRCDGGAIRGDHIVVFAYVERGKTLFVVNLAASFLRQNLRVLYVGNEESIVKPQSRIRANLSNISQRQIEQHGERALQEANKRARQFGMDKNLVLAHLQPGSIQEIDDLCTEHSPDILILDQIRNIGGGHEGLTHRLNANAISIRGLLAKHQCLGVSVAQANPVSHLWLTASDLDSTKVGLPAQADLMIGINANESMLATGERAINLCKNKLSPDHHDGFYCMFDTSKSRVS